MMWNGLLVLASILWACPNFSFVLVQFTNMDEV